MMAEKVEWSDLPKELWPVIGKRLNSTIDILRFRSICNSWRSAIPSSYKISVPRFPRKVTTPFGKRSLSQTTIFRVEFSDCSKDPKFSSKGWLIEVEESKSGQLRLLNPFTNRLQRYQPDISPKVLNLMNFRIIELTKAYSLKYHKIVKIVLFPNFAGKKIENCTVFAVYEEGKLGFSRVGDEKWTLLDDKNFYYDDMIVYKGQLYVVDKWGTISWIDSISLKLVQFSPPLCGFGKKKHLVESCGNLYVVDLHVEGEPNNGRGLYYELLDIKVYKLDEEWGTWVDVKNLGDHLFVLGKDCNFSLSAQDFYDCEENCIYFCYDSRACVFSLASSTFKSPKIFWPSPTLFHPKFSSDQDNVLL